MNNPGIQPLGWPWEKVQGLHRQTWQEPSGSLVSFASRLKLEGKAKVYDLGCGIGRHTVYLARQGFHVYASDVSREGLRETELWLDREGLEARVLCADLASIPFKDRSFDAVVAVNVIYHAYRSGVEACLNEVSRVLAPNGLFYLTFNSTLSEDFGKGRKVDENTYVKEGGIEDGIPHYYVDKDELERLMGSFELLRFSHQEDWLRELGRDGREAHWGVWARRR